jgi:cytoskeletal protein CcmA (bactofilin family)
MTRISRSLMISGELESDEDILIDGCVRGHVRVHGGDVTIGETATVEADIRGARVLVRGNLTGSITATGRIEIQRQATVRGSLSAKLVVLADGAHFDGGIDMQDRVIPARVARHKAEQDLRGAHVMPALTAVRGSR